MTELDESYTIAFLKCGGCQNDSLLGLRRSSLFYLAGFLVIHNLVFMELRMHTQTMEERIEHEASMTGSALVQPLLVFKNLVHEQYRTQFFEMIETQLQMAFYSGLVQSRSIVRDRQSEVQGETK